MKKKTDNTRDESETGVCIKHNQLNYRFYTHEQLSLCVFEVRLAAGNVKLLCLYHLSSSSLYVQTLKTSLTHIRSDWKALKALNFKSF